ncbi:hypothetical protein C9374_003835 [Naegleria lovaniensis]|uniref:OCRE domain-containing protein n=1 Tax=Naegleria lovaniensis TaxID=51637 RepID=A0AA88KSE1_NAELO|nr:uncharacterized protein C9374_003835 [Naegleria lovaniensis]KAG2394071.1 hypothetical protein C9374_003835 [Naegleria lovaniensis]
MDFLWLLIILLLIVGCSNIYSLSLDTTQLQPKSETTITTSFTSISYSNIIQGAQLYKNGVAQPLTTKPLTDLNLMIKGEKIPAYEDALGRPFYMSKDNQVMYFDPNNPETPNIPNLEDPSSTTGQALYDSKKRRYFVDAIGRAFYMDQKTGLPFFIDNNNKDYFIDKYNRIYFRDELGRYYYIDISTGRQIFFLPPNTVQDIPGLDLSKKPQKPPPIVVTVPTPPPQTTTTIPPTPKPQKSTKPPVVVVPVPPKPPIQQQPTPPIVVTVPPPPPQTVPTQPPVSQPKPPVVVVTQPSTQQPPTQSSSIYVNTLSSRYADVVNPNVLAGGPFVDSNGRVYYKDQNGQTTYHDANGQPYYIDPITNQCYVLNKLGEKVDCGVDSSSLTQANSGNSKRTYLYGNDGTIYMVNSNGELIETSKSRADLDSQVSGVGAATTNGASTSLAPAKGYVLVDGKVYWVDTSGDTVPFKDAPKATERVR